MKIEFLRIEKAYKEANMNTREIKAIPNTRHGIVKVDNKEYYFAANTAMKFPVVFGATAEEIYAVLQGLDNKMKEYSEKPFFKNGVKSVEELKELSNVYFDKDTMIIKTYDKYIGFMPGKAGIRAVTLRKGGKHYSCSVNSLIKDLDRPGKMSFRQMYSQGKDIRNMIIKFDKIIEILNNPPINPNNKGPKLELETEEKNDNKIDYKVKMNNNTSKKQRPKRERKSVKDNRRAKNSDLINELLRVKG